MHEVQQFQGVGTVYRADGSALPGERRYALTLVPSYTPDRPLAIGSWVELVGDEALAFEDQDLAIQVADDRWAVFRMINVSETPPHQGTLVVQAWPTRRADGLRGPGPNDPQQPTTTMANRTSRS